jgi:hypothetical protein
MVSMNTHARFFLEIILQAADFTLHARDDVEDPLHHALIASGLGEVTGAGSGLGVSNIDVEVNDLHAGLALVRRVMCGNSRLRQAPSSTSTWATTRKEPAGLPHTPGYQQP